MEREDIIAMMRDFLRSTDPRDPAHIITAHWLSLLQKAEGR